jgi:hypothetical protein
MAKALIADYTDVAASPYLPAVFDAGEAISFSKRGSFRSGSNIGSSRSSAGVSGMYLSSAPVPGTESTCCKAAMARSGSPVCAATRARVSDRSGTGYHVFLNRQHGYPPFRQSQSCRFVAKAHIGQREISNEIIIFRLLLQEGFQFGGAWRQLSWAAA